MLYIIGLGLNDERDISLKAADAMRSCDEIYCEFYTNKWNGSMEALEEIAGKSISLIDREKTESQFLVERAKECVVALLVPGDPLSATTHFQLLADCRKRDVHAKIVHSSSVLTAIAETGLDLYKFGRTTTLPKGFDPQSPHDMIKENKSSGLHTLVLLDIGMTAKEGLELMIKHDSISGGDMVVACFSLGSDGQKLIYAAAEHIIKDGTGITPCCIAVPGKLNEKEMEFIESWKTSRMR